jgi:hypothetical protein
MKYRENSDNAPKGHYGEGEFSGKMAAGFFAENAATSIKLARTHRFG